MTTDPTTLPLSCTARNTCLSAGYQEKRLREEIAAFGRKLECADERVSRLETELHLRTQSAMLLRANETIKKLQGIDRVQRNEMDHLAQECTDLRAYIKACDLEVPLPTPNKNLKEDA